MSQEIGFLCRYVRSEVAMRSILILAFLGFWGFFVIIASAGDVEIYFDEKDQGIDCTQQQIKEINNYRKNEKIRGDFFKNNITLMSLASVLIYSEEEAECNKAPDGECRQIVSYTCIENECTLELYPVAVNDKKGKMKKCYTASEADLKKALNELAKDRVKEPVIDSDDKVSSMRGRISHETI